jgi:class 3 adenylate cyclase/tetratricopeptide (TPR) repeat protein
VLFADLVGFTALAEKVGTEQAYLVVTACLKLMDSIARRCGGSVDRYQGDSLMAVFGYPAPMDEGARASLDAALEMRERVRASVGALELPVPLELHVGVNTGTMVAGDIRGAVAREFHVLGDAVNVAARIKARSPLGAIYVGPETHAEAREGFVFRKLDPLQLKGKSQKVATYELEGITSGPLDRVAAEARLSNTASAPVLARPVLGAHLAPSMDSETESGSVRLERTKETERRRATILFADITGFTAMTERLGAEAAYPIVADCLQLLDEVARQHGGTVEKYLGDCVMALFGVPEAIEDAPRAAVNAAIEMRRRLAEYQREKDLPLPLGVHTGIHTGDSIAGDVSGPRLREFAVMGEPVVVAAALTDLATGGEIFVGPETWRATREQFDYQEGRPFEIPGRNAPIASHRLLSDARHLYRARLGVERELFSDLVGRDSELAQLRKRIDAVVGGDGGFVTLVGEAGLGKSRLLAELARAARERVCWLEGRSLSVSSLRYQPFADLFRSWADITEEDDGECAVSKLEAALTRLMPEEAQEVLPILATVTGAPLSDAQNRRIESVDGEMLEKLILARVGEVLRRISEERPLVLVFDDLHWADLASIQLLESLQRLSVTHPVLFLHVFRPDFGATSDRIREHLRAHHPDRLGEVELQPLGGEAIRVLISNLFRDADIPQRVRARIVDKAGGNPFFVEEVARALIETGAVERDAEGFRATERIHEAEIPGTVQELVMSRIDRLAPRQREIVQVASVIGRSFQLDVLGYVFPGKDALAQDLEALRRGGFVISWGQDRGLEFAFKHPLTQEVAYDAQLEQVRRGRHLEVGHAIEATLSEAVPGYHAMLAYHFSAGGDVERAEHSLFRAGDEAARSAASNEALAFFQEASRLYVEMHPEGGDPAKRARLEQSIGLALYNRGRLIESEQHFNEALRHLGEKVYRGQIPVLLHFVRNLVRVLGGLYFPRARRRPASHADRQAIELVMKRAEVQTYVSPTRFLFDSVDGLARVDQVDPYTVPGAGGLYAGTVGIFTYGGLAPAVSRRFLAKAAPLVRRDDPGEAVLFGMMNHLHHFLTGDWGRRHWIRDELLEKGRRGMNLWPVTTYLGLEAEQRIRCGDFAGAYERMASVDSIWDEFDYDLAKTNHYWLPTCMLLEQRKLRETVRAAEAYYDENPEDLLHILALSYKAQAHTLLGELEAAEAALGKAEQIVSRAKYPPAFHMSSYRTARLVLDLAHLESALDAGDGPAVRAWRRRTRRSARSAVRIVSKVAYRQPEVFRLAGRNAWLAGRTEQALQWWRRSLAVANRLGTRPEEARTAQEAGLRLSARVGAPGPIECREADAWLDTARRTFSELGLEWDLARLDAGAPS